jgi:hypothetical protein
VFACAPSRSRCRPSWASRCWRSWFSHSSDQVYLAQSATRRSAHRAPRRRRRFGIGKRLEEIEARVVAMNAEPWLKKTASVRPSSPTRCSTRTPPTARRRHRHHRQGDPQQHLHMINLRSPAGLSRLSDPT